jgi:hypothetical protein
LHCFSAMFPKYIHVQPSLGHPLITYVSKATVAGIHSVIYGRLQDRADYMACICKLGLSTLCLHIRAL